MDRITTIGPLEIEAESFRIIEEEFDERTGLRQKDIDPSEFALMRRVIHATGDFSFAALLNFQRNAIEAGLNSIRAGKSILTDVNMAASGISKSYLSPHGGNVICKVADPEVAVLARESKRTRSQTAIEEGIRENVGIVAIGNAPTALITVMEGIKEGKMSPDLIVGVPVGFVNASESKEILMEQEYPFISCAGRKGGSTVSVAIVNALLRLV